MQIQLVTIPVLFLTDQNEELYQSNMKNSPIK